MGVYLKEDLREPVNRFFTRDVACAIVQMKNGDSFTYANGAYLSLPLNLKSGNTIMRAVADINDKLMDASE
jgi:hypothetical protein